ncbi:MAG: peptidoglycan editing factor PgeF [Deltaproteobacteria bacterium]|nr:peptidoglycan editing factor PgeF [Deltaproteobacteria bacterium]
MVLRSRLLAAAGFAHGFSTRTGGVSVGPFASLNLGRSVGDDAEAVDENLRRFKAAANLDRARLYDVCQVHGASVRRVLGVEDPATVADEMADALVAAAPAVAVGIRTADCFPVLVADPGTGRALAIHAGWRGVVRGIVPCGLEALAPGPGAIAAIGPGIGPCCFEVGADVAAEISSATTDDVVVPGSRLRIDLRRAIRAQLTASGVTNVEDVGTCTFCDRDAFFSFRRDGKRSGRMLSAIAAPR